MKKVELLSEEAVFVKATSLNYPSFYVAIKRQKDSPEAWNHDCWEFQAYNEVPQWYGAAIAFNKLKGVKYDSTASDPAWISEEFISKKHRL